MDYSSKTKADDTRYRRARRLSEETVERQNQGHIQTSFWLPEKTIKTTNASRCFIESAPTGCSETPILTNRSLILQLNYLYASFFVNTESF